MAKIVVRILGGLGNQLFCYAVARRLSLVNNAELVLDDRSSFAYDIDYKRKYQLDNFNIQSRKATASELFAPFSRVRRYLKRRWHQRQPFLKRGYILHEGVDFDNRMLQIKPVGTVYLEGYWQSEDYFNDVTDIIRQDLQIKPPVDSNNLIMATKIRECMSIAIHVRFFDEPQEPGINNAPGDYYIRALEMMESLFPMAHYFIFSVVILPYRLQW